ncbi:alpha/beta-hydrolase [Karstenula rhodostoma CBS 690.94]|uniref:Alpha/beta-hydrolase n=1 Tax=Karstenula rhodostoma CBS 690.94 TaxID=1392251 RepID=A0A9P4PAL5_9PLEO|nr:alpha/beta-hydrolase [Karstenula rhodostoma CBS 690.94]
MAAFTSLGVVLLAGFVAANTCSNFSIPVEISSRQGVFPNIPAEANLEVTSFAQQFSQQGRNYSAKILQGYATVQGKYEISAKYCQPDNGKASTIQILSHGIGFDKTYWDLSYNNYNYSYVKVANAAGYSTLAIDRLGIGNSSHGDPINEIQAQLEVEALNAVTTLLRARKIPQVKNHYSKVIHVGHSFGSIQSYWLSALYPNNTDGLVLTGYSGNGTFLPSQTVPAWNLHSARLNQPLRFADAPNSTLRAKFNGWLKNISLVQALQTLLKGVGIVVSTDDIWNDIATTEVGNIINGWNVTNEQQLNYPSGYLTHSDLTANQFVFLRYGAYDIGLGVVTEQTKQPVTIGELLTAGSAPSETSFSGPVIIFTGEYDEPFCGLDCYPTGGVAPNIPVQAKKAFPNAQAFEAYIQPNTGHGINAHYNSTAGNEYVQKWLATNGLGA